MASPVLILDPAVLPVSQLESLRFKANQITETIKALQLTLDFHPTAISAWPDILSKYNLLLSQTHSFSSSLAPVAPVNGAARFNGTNPTVFSSPFEKIALHPLTAVTDAHLDTEIIPLLKVNQTPEVTKMENDTVRRLSEHMVTRGSVGVLNGVPIPPPPPQFRASNSSAFGTTFTAPHLAHRKPEYEDVLQECEHIRADHDRRADRAVRAVMLLRDKFEWKPRVAVEVEEPEELDWDTARQPMEEDSDSSEEDEVEGQPKEESPSSAPPSAVPDQSDGDTEMG
ncbi:hypothetical protein D9757_003958 [Collybiopsis confluens]|uniref:Mediator complex subunit 8 n=1 Tax=Collybiopsis confluens TaxID=2823264 RepID=A0A8H5ME29_9AGAR|nr:hypothetical protein D9757_003958 [Collybiopsis confluens]